MENLGLMKAINAKMGYLNHRQSVISQNIANADTPGYQPKDLTDMDFGGVLDKAIDGQSNKMSVRLEETNAMHLPVGGSDNIGTGKSKEQKKGLYEVSPSGNGVVIEQQLINSNKTKIDYNLMTGLYKKNMNMLKTAIRTD